MQKIDLNCDMGESFGVYTLGMDAEIIKYITSANIACGFHAGDPQVMDKTVKLAADQKVGIGAHPGFPDLMGFGRRNIDCAPEEIRNYVIYQVGAISAFCARHGVKLQHVKPHGSLYNMAVADEKIARAIIQAVAGVNRDLLLLLLAGGKSERMARIGHEEGVKIVFEAFADRAYTADGALVSRRLPGAVIKEADAAAERAVMMAKESRVTAIDGSSVYMEFQTLCVHGDTPGAVDMVRRIRECLEREGIAVRRMGE